jgi:hypothetical protein
MPTNRTTGHRRLRWFKTIPGLTVTAIVLVTAGYAGAAGFSILTQTVPAGTAPSAGFGPTCATVAMDTSASAASSSNAEIVYNCTTSAAIDVTTAGTHTPTYTLTTGLTGASLIPATSKGVPSSTATSAACSSYTGAIALTSTVGASLSVGNYDYCFDSSSPGSSITSFTVSWS